MSPEIVQEEKYDQKIDIWGIGVLAHILLCGCPPFDRETNEDVKQAILFDKPSFGGVKSSLTPDAIDFIEHCLKKNPSKRPSAQQLFLYPWITDNIKEVELDSNATIEIAKNLAAF